MNAGIKHPWRRLDAFTYRRADGYEVRYQSARNWLAIDQDGSQMGSQPDHGQARKFIDERRPYDWRLGESGIAA